MHVYSAVYSHTYSYMLLICTQKVYTIALQHKKTQEACVCYTKADIATVQHHSVSMQRAELPDQLP